MDLVSREIMQAAYVFPSPACATGQVLGRQTIAKAGPTDPIQDQVEHVAGKRGPTHPP